MTLTSCELREKDVINVCDGKKLVYICDMDIDTDCGRVTAVYVSDKFFYHWFQALDICHRQAYNSVRYIT